MNEREGTDSDRDDTSDVDDDALSRLMGLAGPRPAIPADIERRVRASVHGEWRRTTRVRRVTRWAAPLALAASVVLAVALTWQPAAVPKPLVGTVARINGAAAPGSESLAVGQRLNAGEQISTAAGQSLSIALANGTSLRMAGGSKLTLDEPEIFTLERGAVYADSGAPAYRDQGIRIDTVFGKVTDVGTQFSVGLAASGLRVAVREGRVDIAHSQQSWSASAGQLLTLPASGDAAVTPIDVDDPSWNWAIAVAPLFEINDHSLFEFLTWCARETGKELVFASDEVRLAAMRTRLHGTVSDLTPDEATRAVLATTQFLYRISGEAIEIDR